MLERFLNNKMAVSTSGVIIFIALLGIFAPFIAPNDPYANDILNKFAPMSAQYPLGTDQLGRCILSRMLYGIRPYFGACAFNHARHNRPGRINGAAGRLF